MLEKKKFILLNFLLGLIFCILLYNKEWGISVFLFTLSCLGLLAFYLKKSGKFIKNITWFLVIPILLISFSYSLYSNPILWAFNFFFVLGLSVMLTILVTDETNIDWGRFKFLIKIIEYLVLPIQYLLKPITILFKNTKLANDNGIKSKILKIVVGLIISIPFLLIIILLLSSADMIFSQMVAVIPGEIGKFFDINIISDFIIQLVIILIIGSYSWSYLYSMSKGDKNNNNVGTADAKEKKGIDSVILITVLIMTNIVYAVFCFVQFSYLFGGGISALPNNLTYSEYARQGFFQLILVSIINLSLILGIVHSTRNDNKIFLNIIKTLLMLIGAATFIMLYSSFFRMRLYEQNYGYTYLRIFVYFFLTVEAIMLIGTCYYIFKNNFNILKMYIITVIVCYTILNYINVDKMIAKNNIDKFMNTGNFDVGYLTYLSYDSYPEMARVIEANVPQKEAILKRFNEERVFLNAKRSLVEFNYGRYKAMKIVNMYK